MNCRLIRPRNDCTAAKIADPGRRPELETMMAKLYRFWTRPPEVKRVTFTFAGLFAVQPGERPSRTQS
jgi:hypothetical protein